MIRFCTRAKRHNRVNDHTPRTEQMRRIQRFCHLFEPLGSVLFGCILRRMPPRAMNLIDLHLCLFGSFAMVGKYAFKFAVA